MGLLESSMKGEKEGEFMSFKVKKSTLILSIITILVLALYVISTQYIKTNTKKFHSLTEIHLIERGYSKEDINSIEVSHSYLARILSYEEWNISVAFKDEPEAIYYYSYRNNKVEQSGVSGRLNDGIYDHDENPDENDMNIRVAGKYIKNQGYTISKVIGEVDKYELEKSIFQKSSGNLGYKQIWRVQKVKPQDYFGKEVIVIGFNVRNHPLQKKDINAKDGVRLNIMIIDDKVIGGYSLPITDTVGGFYSLDGKTVEEIKILIGEDFNISNKFSHQILI